MKKPTIVDALSGPYLELSELVDALVESPNSGLSIDSRHLYSIVFLQLFDRSDRSAPRQIFWSNIQIASDCPKPYGDETCVGHMSHANGDVDAFGDQVH